MAFPEERRSRPQRNASGRRRVPIEYDSDVDLEIDVNDDFFKPRERDVYRVYENRSRKPPEYGGKRISIISITSDDDADAARLRLLQNKQRAAQNNSKMMTKAKRILVATAQLRYNLGSPGRLHPRRNIMRRRNRTLTNLRPQRVRNP